MGAKRTVYSMTGRYMDGKEVVGYHLLDIESGKAKMVTREQAAYLVGRGQILNVVGQIYKDQLIFKGENGFQIDGLPVQQSNGEITRTGNVGHISRNMSNSDVLQMLYVTAAEYRGKAVIGYRVQTSAGQVKRFSKEDTYKLALDNRLGNARLQYSNGMPILRCTDQSNKWQSVQVG